MNATNEMEYDCSKKKDVDSELTSQHAIQDAIETGDNACAPSLPPSHSTAKTKQDKTRQDMDPTNYLVRYSISVFFLFVDPSHLAPSHTLFQTTTDYIFTLSLPPSLCIRKWHRHKYFSKGVPDA